MMFVAVSVYFGPNILLESAIQVVEHIETLPKGYHLQFFLLGRQFEHRSVFQTCIHHDKVSLQDTCLVKT